MRRVAIALALVAMSTGAFAVSGGFAAPKATSAAVTVNVTATDFKFRLSRLSVVKGTVVTFKVINKGNTAHDFDFASGVRGGTPYLAGLKTATFKVTFRKVGTYRFVCTVPRHVQLGMAGYFRVKA